MRKLYVLAIWLMLAGCAAPNKTPDVSAMAFNVTHEKVVSPPADLFNCPAAIKISKQKIQNMTDLGVAKILYKSIENNKQCYASLQAIKEYINEAERELNE